MTSSDQAVTTTNGLPVNFVIAAPTITTDFSHAPDPVLVGQSVTFTGTASTNGTPLSYAWNFGDGAQATGLNATHVYTRHGSYTVVFTATDGCGFVGTQSHLVTVNAPTLAANFTQSATSIIVNNTVRFTDTSTTNGPGLAGWRWTFGDGGFSSAQHPTHLYTTVGVYNVTLLITDSLGYTATHSANVTVNAPALTANFTQSATSIIVNNTVRFTDTSTTDGPGLAGWRWTFGDGGFSSAQHPTHLYYHRGRVQRHAVDHRQPRLHRHALRPERRQRGVGLHPAHQR